MLDDGDMAMQRSNLQFERLLKLDQELRQRKYPNCFKLAAACEISVKTAQRDFDYMRDRLNAPIKYDQARKGFYYTSGNWFLPALSLSEGDLFAVLLASRVIDQYKGTPVAKELEAIFQKITDSMPERISIRPELVFSRFTFVGPAAKPVDEKIWSTVVRGLLAQRSVQIEYRSPDSAKSKARLVDPYHVANLHGEWYVFAFDHRGNELRQFAIPRIEKAELTDTQFVLPADFDPEKILSVTFGRFAHAGSPETVRLLFDREVAYWVLERQWHPKQKVKRRRDGKVELSFPTLGLYEVRRWVLAWGHNVRVLAPKELKDMVRKEIRLMVAKVRII